MTDRRGPTDLADLKGAIAALSPEQLELLRRRMSRIAPPAGARPAGGGEIPRHSREAGRFPLSFSQQRFWVLDRLQPGSPANNIAVAVCLAGSLDRARLAASLNEVFRRQEALRTVFPATDGEPFQVVLPPFPAALPQIDLAAVSAARRGAELARQAGAAARWSFDLARGPLARLVLVDLGPGEHAAFLIVHHIIADRWSLGILLAELLAGYEALGPGGPRPLPAIELQWVDYVCWQRERLQGDLLASELAFWRRELSGAPTLLELPTDRPRRSLAATARPPQGQHRFLLASPLIDELRRFGQAEEATLFMVLLAAFAALLGRFTGQHDLLVGSPVANRNRAHLQSIIGQFVGDLVLRCRLGGDPEMRELLARVRAASVAAFAHSEVPLEKLIEELQPERAPGRPPLVQVFFIMETVPAPRVGDSGLTLTPLDFERPAGPFDLLFYLSEEAEGVHCNLLYDAQLFRAETAALLAESYASILRQALAEPAVRLSSLRLAGGLEAAASRARAEAPALAVAATFTAEPLAEPLALFLSELGWPPRVGFAPYGQLFQELLDAGSLLARNRAGINLVLLRFADWLGEARASASASAAGELRSHLDDLARALRAAAARSPAPCLVAVCPSASLPAEPAQAKLFAELEVELARALASLNGVYLLPSAELGRLYPVAEVFDPTADSLGHVPFTPVFFAALATHIARAVRALCSPAIKVIAVDCDDTLWSGVCGEEGPHGITIGPAHEALQRFLLRQREQGVLLCLCSKNREEDVRAVFRERRDLPLGLAHVAALRIGWGPKSAGLRALAAELGLGLESFAFLDDNPLERAEVRAHCPEVLVVEPPADWGALPALLDHYWAFDRLAVTAEDTRRATLYQQNAERERSRREALSFAEFLASLDLRVEIAPLRAERIGRVAQLTQRTNQFNSSAVRRSAAELESLLASGALEALAIEVCDRFGDYGLVGAVLFRAEAGDLVVDTLLLSCRALGKGVEHRMLAHLGRLAGERGLLRVVVPCREMPRNHPVRDFLAAVGGAHRQPAADGVLYAFPAGEAERVVFVPPEASASAAEPEQGAAAPPAAGDRRGEEAWLDRMARELSSPQAVLAAVAARRGIGRRALGGEAVPPRTPIEELLVELWKEILAVDAVGIHDSFFRLGGHSLLGTLVLSRLQRAVGVELPLLTLFEAPTVAGLAERVEAELVGRLGSAELTSGLEELAELSDAEIAALLARERDDVLKPRGTLA